MGRNGMVAAGHPLASEAGIATLRRGGNAIDAAMAVAAALGVVEPESSGVGGDGFIMIYRRGAAGGDPALGGTVEVVNATGAAPLAATPEAYRDGIPMKGIRSVSTPGLIDGWLQAHVRHGRIGLADCFAPAIGLAGDGFPISHRLAKDIAGDAALLEFPSSREIFAPSGRPLGPGELLRQRDLATTLATIAREGRAAFYEGAIAQAIVASSQRHGGMLAMEDFARCHAQWQAPIATDYRGYRVLESPPNSSGHILLQELNLIEGFDIAALGCNSAAAIHLMVEAKRLAFADRERYMADPDWVDVPIEGLVSKAYAAERRRLIDPGHARTSVSAGDPWPHTARTRRDPPAGRRTPARQDTTCFAVVDGEGNAVCQIQSIQSVMGSALVAEGTGILLNNRMTYWHLEADHVDRLEPGKRVRHTMNTVMVFHDGGLFLVHGTPGADTQVQTNLQVLTHVIDHGMNVVEAVEAPRWRHVGRGTESTVPHGEADALNLEARFPESVRDELKRRGHPVHVLGDWEGQGNEVAIQVDRANGALHGACDPRRDGYAIGY
jgi:gamma-glutamyltranspeptidase/glutathione hydrolase